MTEMNGAPAPLIAIIGDQLFRLPPRHLPGAVMSADHAAILNHIWLRNLASNLTTWLKRHPRASAADLQLEADRLSADYELGWPRGDSDTDPIERAALSIARDLLVRRLQAEGVPEPKDLDHHAQQILDRYPQIREQAAAKIEAQLAVDREMLNTLEKSA